MFVDLEWIAKPIKEPHAKAKKQAMAHFAQITTIDGSLGMFEELATRLAGMQRNVHPKVDPARVVIFAADHGMVSDSPCTQSQTVTRSMVYDCLRGVSPVAQMTRQLDVDLELVDVGMIAPSAAMSSPVCSSQSKKVCFIEQSAAFGSADFRFGPAMTHEQFSLALRAGKDAVNRAVRDKIRLFIGGEISIGGMVSASAIISAVLKNLPECFLGSGKSSLPPETFPHIVAMIQQGLDVHVPFHDKAMESLRRMGGFEIAALTGAFIACGQRGIPAVVDGFVASTAALVAISAHPPLKEWLIFAHRSAEPGQLSILKSLNVQPVLDLNMHWGEATGATAVLPILRLACGFLPKKSMAKR